VGKDGSPQLISATSTGDESAEQTALKAAQSWRFQPATANGSKRSSRGKILLECGGPAAGDGDDTSSPVLRVGKGVSPPAVIFKVEPEYSGTARQARWQGDVQVSAIVETSGRLSNVRMLKPPGLDLDQHVLAALSQWRFKPAIKDGQPVRVVAQIAVNFRLL
jgi:TonB family protein